MSRAEEVWRVVIPPSDEEVIRRRGEERRGEETLWNPEAAEKPKTKSGHGMEME